MDDHFVSLVRFLQLLIYEKRTSFFNEIFYKQFQPTFTYDENVKGVGLRSGWANG